MSDKPTDLTYYRQEYSCGCSKSFRVDGVHIQGLQFICYEHGVGVTLPSDKEA